MRRSSVAALCASLLLAHGCGGGSKSSTGPNNSNSGAGTMSASIDGTAWNALAVTSGKATGSLIISGSDLARTVTISFLPPAVGTQPGGPIGIVLATVIIGSQGWQANAVGLGGGTVSLATLTSTRAAGTFTFSAVASQGATPASRQITNGKFDVRY